uniref:Uncharacterized protein n=1 Tax=Plectus sambesii TaxID=2011161 RepID=A0A914UZS9_9BILA
MSSVHHCYFVALLLLTLHYSPTSARADKALMLRMASGQPIMLTRLDRTINSAMETIGKPLLPSSQARLASAQALLLRAEKQRRFPGYAIRFG